jgi:pyruvate dehydrogenase E2 component (dihydrolipoamide acetyltransferase)
MAVSVIIPRLGWNMEEGTFLGWLKKDGDLVRPGEALFRLESDKATEDIECLDSGILRIVPGGPKEGDKVPVGMIIGHIARPGEQVQIDARRVQMEKPVSAHAQPASQPAISNLQSSISDLKSSPRARRVAAELGVDWTRLQGSGHNGRIRERDVRAATLSRTAGGTIVPLTPLRRAAAARLVQSRQSTVPVTLTTTCDVTNLVALHQQFKATDAAETVPSLTDFFVKLTALALESHPLLAARWAEDHLILPDAVNIGIAVACDAGLLVPVLHEAAALGLRQLASRSRELIDRARRGKLTVREMEGGVFTVTNLGMFGIDAFTPVINYPECAVLGIGRIRRVPAFVEDKVVAQDQVTLSLTFDHRIVDGAPAARFLQSLTEAARSPGPWLMP